MASLKTVHVAIIFLIMGNGYYGVAGRCERWGGWSSCSESCDSGIRERERTCTDGDGTRTESDMKGCMLRPCFSEGRCTRWGKWSSCSKTCGDGVRERHRDCEDDGMETTLTRSCFIRQCRPAKWSRWSKWSECVVIDICGEGIRTRTRSCIAGDSGEEDCVGSDLDLKECEIPCVKAQWTRWGDWSDCDVTCGEGERSRKRTCISGDRGEKDCGGWEYDSKSCRKPPCVEPARWSDWGEWSECSESCGDGVRDRSRTCINGGWFGPQCMGSDYEYESCNERTCIYAEWSNWSECSVSCGIGDSYRTRMCIVEGDVLHPDCPGSDYENEACDKGPCAGVDAPWYVIILQEKKNILMEINEARLGGGSLINDRWVLTAAHAVESLSQTAATSAILVLGIKTKISGGTSIPSHAQIYRAETVLIHPGFKTRTYDFDIALIKVGERLRVNGNDLASDLLGRYGSVEFDSYTSPVSLPCISACDHVRNREANGIKIASYNRRRCLTYATNIKSTDNPDVLWFGFGINDSSGLYSYDMKLQKDDTCKTAMRKIRKTHEGASFTTRNLCTARNPPPQPCQGSAGDPLVKEIQLSDSSKCRVQVGLFTKNWSCSSSTVQYYTDVTHLSIPWIFKSMK